MLKYAKICCANSLAKKGVPANFYAFCISAYWLIFLREWEEEAVLLLLRSLCSTRFRKKLTSSATTLGGVRSNINSSFCKTLHRRAPGTARVHSGCGVAGGNPGGCPPDAPPGRGGSCPGGGYSFTDMHVLTNMNQRCYKYDMSLLTNMNHR